MTAAARADQSLIKRYTKLLIAKMVVAIPRGKLSVKLAGA